MSENKNCFFCTRASERPKLTCKWRIFPQPLTTNNLPSSAAAAPAAPLLLGENFLFFTMYFPRELLHIDASIAACTEKLTLEQRSHRTVVKGVGAEAKNAAR
jgi:hypothetical protein